MKVNLFYCSLCRRSQNEREFIIAGPDNINICDQCVDYMVDILREEKAKKERNQYLEEPTDKQNEIDKYWGG
jgi:ATP-dependent Clp protease ATP-binding subunit ClpX